VEVDVRLVEDGMGWERNSDARVALGTGTALQFVSFRCAKIRQLRLQWQTVQTSQAGSDTSSPAQKSQVKDGKPREMFHGL